MSPMLAAAATGLPVTMVGSVPDMSANWAAKVAVSTEQQADAVQMAQVYITMAQQFLSGGLNLPAIEAQRYSSATLTENTTLHFCCLIMAAHAMEHGCSTCPHPCWSWHHRQFYGDLDSTHPTPLQYEDFKVPLEKGAVRLGILQPPPALCKAAGAAASAIESVLPAG